MGPFGVIPKPFRMVSYSEASPNRKAVPNGWLFHVFTQLRKHRTECRRIWLHFEGFEWLRGDLSGFNQFKLIL